MTKRSIYLDHGATTPVHPQVLEAMLPYWTDYYGNPSSHHVYGREAESALVTARKRIAELIGAAPDEIIFTANGSASDNLAMRGVVKRAHLQQRKCHIIISAIEHSAIIRTALQLVDLFDCDLTILPVDRYGQVRINELEAAIRPDTTLISIMAANNEIGTLQPIEDIGSLAHEHGILFHTDAVQAAAHQAWNLSQLPIDLFSMAPHKFYGPKGIGILYARRGIELLPTLTGGGQEDGRRAGTENVAFAVGAAKALELAAAEMEFVIDHYQALVTSLTDGLIHALPNDCQLTGHPVHRIPNNASFAFRSVSGNDILMHLDIAGISASSGSACKSGDPKPSAVLEAIGLEPDWTKGGLRFTVGRQNSADEIDYVIQTLPPIIEKLQELNYVLD
jgi:cysteine desulfurase